MSGYDDFSENDYSNHSELESQIVSYRSDSKSKYHLVAELEEKHKDFFDYYNPITDEDKLKKIDNQEGDKHKVTFLLKKIVKEINYSKWFDAIGIDVKTGEGVLLPIRNNVVDEFVDENWNTYYTKLDQWDLYKILVRYSIPVVWCDKSSYWLPTKKTYVKRYWKLLDAKMNKERYEPDPYVDYIEFED